MINKPISQIALELRNKDYSSRELTQFYLNRIATIDPLLNSFITVTADHALKQADAADELLKNNSQQTTLLTGIPIAHKDTFCTTGIKTSCGSKMLDNFIAPYNATIVEKLNAAGSVMVGKTNLDEFAMGSSNENSYYGAVKNPWDLERVPGGSSGGSAAAVAGWLVPACTGTDTGGSVRQPAALCGITGLKPTYGRISRYGMVAYASSLDQAGWFAHYAEDIAILMQYSAGLDVRDSTSADIAVPDYLAQLNQSLKGLRIGVPEEYFVDGLDKNVADVAEQTIAQLEKMGAHIQRVHLPHTHLSIPVYYVVALAECSSNLARYDGVRYGYRCENSKDLNDLYQRSRGEGFGAEVKRRILLGTYVLSSGYYDAYYIKAQKVRQLIASDFQQAFNEVDLILGPTTPTPAFKLGEKTSDPISMYLSDIYTVAVNLAGLPAISFPAGFAGNCPIGMQLIGNHFAEDRLLNAVHQYQQFTDWHQRTPAGVNV